MAGRGALCEGETHFKLKALRSGEEGAAVSEPRLLSAQVSRLRSSGHNSCDALILWTCRESCFFAKRERFLYFSGRRDEPSSIRFHCRLTLIIPILTPSSPNPILAQQRGRDRGRGARAHWISNSTKLSRSPRPSRDSVQAPLPASPPCSPRGPEERWPNFQVHYNLEIELHRGLVVREVTAESERAWGRALGAGRPDGGREGAAPPAASGSVPPRPARERAPLRGPPPHPLRGHPPHPGPDGPAGRGPRRQSPPPPASANCPDTSFPCHVTHH